MVWQVLDALGRGESWDDIANAWAGRVTKPAIAEAVRLARQALLDKKGATAQSDHSPACGMILLDEQMREDQREILAHWRIPGRVVRRQAAGVLPA